MDMKTNLGNVVRQLVNLDMQLMQIKNEVDAGLAKAPKSVVWGDTSISGLTVLSKEVTDLRTATAKAASDAKALMGPGIESVVWGD